MEKIEILDLGYLIPNIHFQQCEICKEKYEVFKQKYKWHHVRGLHYKLNMFIHHIQVDHHIQIKEYCQQYLNIQWPRCPKKHKDVGWKVTGKGLKLSKYNRGAGLSQEECPKFKAACERFSRERVGVGNPMFGKEPWNKGLGLENPIIKATADKWRGSKMSEESKVKMRQRRAESPIKARHTQPHTPEVVEKMRETTAKLWASGVFSRETSIYKKMREFLQSLNLKYPFQEEYQMDWYSIDFAWPDQKIALEADGDYYHINPLFYPDGPKDRIQRRNFGRDRAKNKYLAKKGWTILRHWECEINSGVFKEKLINQLKSLNII